MAMAEDGEASMAAPSPFERLRLGFQGLRLPSAAEQEASGGEAPDAGASSKPAGASWGSWADRARRAVIDKAREVAYDAVPQREGEPSDEQQDAERGETQPQWTLWAKAAAGRVRNQVVEATKDARQGIAQAAEKAKSVEWGEQAKGWQSEFARGLGKVTDSATQATSTLSEKGKLAQQMAKDLQGKSQQKLAEAKAMGAAKAHAAKEKAAAAAGSVKAAAAAGAGKVTQGLSGLSALAVSPAKLAQFGAVFFLGVFLLSMSFSFLPMLPISPQKFALLFAFGSITLLSSFAILKGPKAFATGLFQREKIPFSVSYLVGLVGTLVATIVLRSYIYTALFGLIQAIALLYFLASYVPGGQALLNACGRLCGRCARRVCRRGQ